MAQPLDSGHPCDRERAQRRAFPLVDLLQDLRADACHVDIGGAFSPAALACEAAFQHFLDLRRSESIAVCQAFSQYIRPGAGSHQFVASSLEGRTHRAADEIGLAAIAGAVALLDGAHERVRLTAHAAGAIDLAFVEGRPPVKYCLCTLYGVWLSGLETEPFIHAGSIDDLVHIERVIRIPAALDLLHETVAFLAVHQGDELATEAAVAVLAAETAAVLTHQRGSLLGHGTEKSPPVLGLQIDDRPKMQFARADMAVENALQAEAVQHGAEVAHIRREAFGRNRRVLYDSDRLGIAFHAAEHAETGLAQGPDARHVGPVHPRAGVREAACEKLRFERVGARVHFRSAELRNQQRRRIALDEKAVALRLKIVLPKLQYTPVHQLDSVRRMPQRNQIRLEAGLE